MMADLALYLHIPFCVRKCAYCDFFSGAFDEQSKALYFHALKEEIGEKGRRLSGQGWQVRSVYFGGGTPSLMPERTLNGLMEALHEAFSIGRDAEISMEANPGTVDEHRLRRARAAGINRLSIGLQSTEDRLLKSLGRIHSFSDFLSSYEAARKAGFDNINIDLMQGIPGQSVRDWQKTLETAVSLAPEHISAYSLIIEENTAFYTLYGEDGPGCSLLPSEEEDREMYHLTGSFLAKAGYSRYEISNYARPGRACRHNIAYWTGVPYLGFGAAAASYMPAEAGSGALMKRAKHAEDLAYRRLPDTEIEYLDEEDLMSEFMILGLRMTSGISETEFLGRFNRPLRSVYGTQLERFLKLGLLKQADGRIFLSEYGLDVANAVLAEFLPA